jgi:hypothetical protein
MKLSEAIDKVNKLTVDCNDLKDALCTLEVNAEMLSMEAFMSYCAGSERVSTSLLLSSLVLLEEELKALLDAEIIVQEVPGE